jgi:hypothetical protein
MGCSSVLVSVYVGNDLCPELDVSSVPGCGSTFTRHFNLKGHLRSHNDERPYKCLYDGCPKGELHS